MSLLLSWQIYFGDKHQAKRRDLKMNNNITAESWLVVMKLVCNSEDVRRVVESNHIPPLLMWICTYIL